VSRYRSRHSLLIAIHGRLPAETGWKPSTGVAAQRALAVQESIESVLKVACSKFPLLEGDGPLRNRGTTIARDLLRVEKRAEPDHEVAVGAGRQRPLAGNPDLQWTRNGHFPRETESGAEKNRILVLARIQTVVG